MFGFSLNHVVTEGDLYVTISKEFDSDVDVQSWGCQYGRVCEFTTSDGKTVANIPYIKTDLGSWKPTKDHSKWCVAEAKQVTCIADVNRSDSQFGRRGGALCLEDKDITNIFKNFETCPPL